MDDTEDNEPLDKNGLEHGYTPPNHQRRKPLRQGGDLSRRKDEMLYIQIVLGVVVLLLLLWFLYHIYREKQRNATFQRSSIERVIEVVYPENLTAPRSSVA